MVRRGHWIRFGSSSLSRWKNNWESDTPKILTFSSVVRMSIMIQLTVSTQPSLKAHDRERWQYGWVSVGSPDLSTSAGDHNEKSWRSKHRLMTIAHPARVDPLSGLYLRPPRGLPAVLMTISVIPWLRSRGAPQLLQGSGVWGAGLSNSVITL
jgi:hypothetical protein